MPRTPRASGPVNNAPAYTRWAPPEYLAVAVNALAFLDQHMPALEALGKSQRLCLPRTRWRVLKEVTKSNLASFAIYVDKARALTPNERNELLVTPHVEAAAVVAEVKEREAAAYPSERKEIVRWSLMEKARVARALKLTEGLGLKYYQRVLSAMESTLPPERWFNRGSLSAACSERKGTMVAAMKEGAANEWLLKEEAKPEPIAEPVTGSNALDLEAGATLQRAQEATHPPGSLAEALQAFANTINGAVSSLVLATQAHTVATIEAKLDDLATQIGLRLQNDMRATVLSTLGHELGGPVSPPPEPKAAPAKVEVTSGHGTRLHVDVVGLTGHTVDEVRRAFNGNTDLRFYEPEKLHSWKPSKDRHAILMTKFLPHKADKQAQAAGVKVIRINGSAGLAIQAIESLHQAAGIVAHG